MERFNLLIIVKVDLIRYIYKTFYIISTYKLNPLVNTNINIILYFWLNIILYLSIFFLRHFSISLFLFLYIEKRQSAKQTKRHPEVLQQLQRRGLHPSNPKSRIHPFSQANMSQCCTHDEPKKAPLTISGQANPISSEESLFGHASGDEPHQQ